jgi:cardiolipin synthase A/B
MAERRTSTWKIVVATVAATLLAVFIVLNAGLADKKIEQRIESLHTVDDPQFLRTMGVMLGPPLLAGNRAETLVNGHQIFPAMLKAISEARKTISFETYIYWEGTIGKQFVDALVARARAGVKVHVLLDWVGSGKIDTSYIEEMERAGVEVKRYNRPHWYTFGRFNNRTHRKLLVVDGRIGFTGGVGIADLWSGNAQDRDHWRDTHFLIEGPAVAQMQSAFHDNWVEVTGKVLHGADYYPPLKPVGPHYAQIFTSSPGGGGESMQLMYLLSIAAASKNIRLSASYFVPDKLSVDTFVAALNRGVKIQIILPGPIVDTDVVRRASRAAWRPLLRAGAEIYEYQPTMFHSKVMVVDDIWTSVGSTNFDNRSFSINDEANLNVYDRDFGREQIRIFEEDLKQSRRITLDEWENRPWMEKLWENTIALFSSQL